MSYVLFEIKNNVGFITLNRPDKFNSFNREMSLQLQTWLDECAGETEVRCVYMTGMGKAFSAGQDLGEVTGIDAISIDRILSEHYNPIIRRIRNLAKPVVAAVNGVAAGAGANIALCCDIIVAAESASFIQAFSKIGLIPDSGGTYFLPRLIGWQKATAIMMLGDKIPASDAEKIGMIYKSFADEEFVTQSTNIANGLAHMPTKALALTKEALNNSFENTFEKQILKEDELQRKAAATDDYNEGVQAFLGKRKAIFTGK